MAKEKTQDAPADAGDTDKTVSSGAEAIFGLLQQDEPSVEDTSDDSEAPADDDPESEDVESEEDEPEEDEPGESEDDDLEDEEDEDDPEDRDQAWQFTDEELARPVTRTVGGEDVTLPLSEWLDGSLRQQDYTRKTMALADERKAFRDEAQSTKDELAGLRAEYAEQLEVIGRALDAPAPDWEKVRAENPNQYPQIRAQYDERKEQLANIRSELDRVRTEAQEQAAAAQKERLEHEQDRLQAAIPEWTDDTVKAKETKNMVQLAIDTYGFSPQELEGVIDHRPLVMLRDLLRYHEMLDSQKRAKDELKAKRKKSPTLDPARVSDKSGDRKKSSKAARAARNRLAETGTVRDAAAALFELMD